LLGERSAAGSGDTAAKGRYVLHICIYKYPDIQIPKSPIMGPYGTIWSHVDPYDPSRIGSQSLKHWPFSPGCCRLARLRGQVLRICAALWSVSVRFVPRERLLLSVSGGRGGRFCVLCPGRVSRDILERFLGPAEIISRCYSLATLRRPAGSPERHESVQGRYPGNVKSPPASNKTSQGPQMAK